MLTDKTNMPEEELRAVHTKIMAQLTKLINQNLIHHRDYQEIEKYLATAVEEAIWY
jgi:hypothetical protein